MKDITIEKTNEGFVLLHSSFHRGTMILLLLFTLTVAILPWVLFYLTGLPDVGVLLLMAACSVTLAACGIYFVYTSFGQRLIFDHSGVRLYHFRRCKREIPWRHVTSIGITDVFITSLDRRIREQFLYVSTQADWRNDRKRLTIRMTPTDITCVREAGLMRFCDTHRWSTDEE